MPILINPGESKRGSHRISVANECTRKYAFKYQYREQRGTGTSQRQENHYMVRGSLLHAALAHHYQAHKASGGEEYYTPQEALREISRRQLEQGASLFWASELDLMLRCYQAYDLHYGTEPEWKVISVEEEHELWLIDDKAFQANGDNKQYLYTQRSDLVVEVEGRVFIVDHKSTGKLSGYTFSQETLNPQFLGYQVIGQLKYGDKFGGVIINGIQVPKSLDDCNFKYARDLVPSAPHAVKDYVSNVLHLERTFDAYNHLPPVEWPTAAYGRECPKCPYFDTCRRG